ncbi:MAG: hypothetical protein ACTSP0_04160 [Alphaproteobacteria bacterium]
MARASKAGTASELSLKVQEATEAATENVLRLAAEAGNSSDPAGNAATIVKLAHMCEEAAGHMAKAQAFMFEGVEGGEAAIEHLDAALHCLNRLAEESQQHKTRQSRAAKSA